MDMSGPIGPRVPAVELRAGPVAAGPPPAPAPARPTSPDGWAPRPHDLIPILPRGTALFEGIPAPAIVIEALGPVLGDGVLVSRRPGAVGVILVKDRGLLEVYSFEGGKRLEGEKALQLISGWGDATVSAYQFDPIVIAVAPALFRGGPCYEDLRLDWTDWRGLLADLCSRDEQFVVELDTPLGRGVTLILDGRQVATYTETHPELGEEGLLDPLAGTRRGTIWVRRQPAGGAAPVSVRRAVAAPATARPEKPGVPPVAAKPKETPVSVGIDWSTTPLWRAQPAAPNPNEPFNPFAVLDPDAALEDAEDDSPGGSSLGAP